MYSFLEEIVGEENVSRDEAELITHSVDAFPMDKWYKPDVVVRPITTEEISKILKRANEERIPVTPWASASSISGNAVPIQGGIVIDMRRMDRIIDVREKDLQVVVEPGVIYDRLNKALEEFRLFFPPAPGSASIATIGGMAANNASGMKSVKYGGTKDYVLKLKVVLASGEVVEVGSNARKSASGYDLVSLFVGSEGTLGIFTEITLRLVAKPKAVVSAKVLFESIEDAALAVSGIMAAGLVPAAIEVMSIETIKAINKYSGLGLKEVDAMLLIDLDGNENAITDELKEVEEICRQKGAIEIELAETDEDYEALWAGRRSAYPSLVRAKPSPITGDVVVPISRYPDMVRKTRELSKKYGVEVASVGHAGDGNIHDVIGTDRKNPEEWKLAKKIIAEIISYAISLGGTASGEHGIGIEKREFMRLEHGNALDIMKNIKDLLDPNGILNPGKIFEEENTI